MYAPSLECSIAYPKMGLGLCFFFKMINLPPYTFASNSRITSETGERSKQVVPTNYGQNQCQTMGPYLHTENVQTWT